MPLLEKPLGEILTYSRASGATRVNALGLLVGVDFSSTSNNVATGSRTFTLGADLGIDRDWVVGSAVRVVDQVGGAVLLGTVTSYAPASQQLVINVTSVTGSGTGLTNWRIGSLETRLDFDPVRLQPKGFLVEGGATNAISNATLSPNTPTNGMIRRLNTGIAPTGNTEATEFETTATGISLLTINGVTAGNGRKDRISFFVKVITLVGELGNCGIVSLSRTSEFRFGLFSKTGVYKQKATTTFDSNDSPLEVTSFPNGWYLVEGSASLTGDGTALQFYINNAPAGTIVQVWQPNIVTNSAVRSSTIPTNGVAVTRAADLPNIDGTRFRDIYPGDGAVLYIEATPIASAVGAVAGSLNDGTLNNAIRIQQKQSVTQASIRKMATDGVTDVMAVNASTGNTLRSNGVDYTEVSDQSGQSKLGVASSGVGSFLNVGGGENFRSSADSGLTYNARTIGGNFGGAHFGIGRFVVAGSTSTINGATVGSVIVSTDGLAFRRVNIPGLAQQLTEIASNGTNQYVAVGGGGVIYTSPDAETWTAQTSGTTAAFGGVAFFNGRYVAANGTANQSKYSDNGTTWISVTGLAAGMVDVAHNGTNLWVAVGNGGAIYSSADGIGYTVRTSGVTQNLNGIHFADGLWVAVGNTGTVVTSPDGITWTDRTANSGIAIPISEVNFFNGKFYYIGDGPVIGESTAANIVANVTWTARTAGIISNLNGIAHNGSRLLICGTAGGIATSDDGTTFTSRTGNNTTLNGAAFGAGTYVIVGNAANGSGLIATVNPTTFEYQRRSPGFGANNIFDVIRSGSRFIIAAATNRMGYSDDNGVTWVPVAPPVNNTTDFLSLATDGVTVVSVGAGGRLIVSADNGSTWSTYNAGTTVGTTQQQNGVSWANGVFVSVGNGGTISTSPTGAIGSWTLRTSGVTSTLHSVMYSTRDQQWYAAGDGGVILRAADPTGAWESIANDAATAIIRGGAVQANPTLPNWIVGQTNRIVTRFNATAGLATSVNGSPLGVDGSVQMPGVNRFSLGMNGVNGGHFNGWIRRVGLRTDAVSDANLIGAAAGTVNFFNPTPGALA